MSIPSEVSEVIGWIVASAVVIVGFFWFIFSTLEKKRKEAFRRFSMRHGYSYSETGELAALLGPELKFTKRAKSPKIRNVLRSSLSGGEQVVFDLRYTRRTGNGQQLVWQTVFAFRGSSLNLPAFRLQPEYFFHRWGNLFGLKDINFEAYPKFSKMYLLQGDKEEEIRTLFKPELLHFLEGHPKQFAEGKGNELIIYLEGRRTKLQDLSARVEMTKRFFELVKGSY